MRIEVRFANKENGNIDAIKRDGAEYGFDGLIIYPVMNLGDIGEGVGIVKVNEAVAEELGMTYDEIFEKGIENIDYTIKTMRDTLIECMFPDGVPEEDSEMIDMMLPPDENGMLVITNERKFYGATSVIAATKELIDRFPNGYVVLPSSVHEVIVLPYEEGNEEELNDIVKQVNAGVLSADDFLSDDIYIFEA